MAEELVDDQQLLQAIAERESTVDRLLQQKNNTEAVRAALTNPPFGTKQDELKEQNYVIVAKALGQCKDDELKSIVECLSTEQHDNLMKYLYKGLAMADNSGQLLKWHAVLVEKAGHGCIMRAMTDRKTV